MKKVLSLILILTLSLGMVTSSFANANLTSSNLENEFNLKIVEETDNKRVVESIEGEIKEIITVDKKTNILTSVKINIENNEIISKEFFDLNKSKKDIIELQSKLQTEKKLSSRLIQSRSSHYQNTFSNYEYEEYNDGMYELRRKDEYAYRSILVIKMQ